MYPIDILETMDRVATFVGGLPAQDLRDAMERVKPLLIAAFAVAKWRKIGDAADCAENYSDAMIRMGVEFQALDQALAQVLPPQSLPSQIVIG